MSLFNTLHIKHTTVLGLSLVINLLKLYHSFYLQLGSIILYAFIYTFL